MYAGNRLDAFFNSVAVELSWVKRWDSEEMRMPGCVRIADSDEHTAHHVSSRVVGWPTGC